MTKQRPDRYFMVGLPEASAPMVGLVLVLGSVLPLTGAAGHGTSRGAR